MIVRVDSAGGAVSHRQVLPGGETIAAIAPAGRHLVVAGDKGALFVLSADDLTPRAMIAPKGWTGRAAQRLLVVGDRLYLTTHAGAGDNGSLLILDGWRP